MDIKRMDIKGVCYDVGRAYSRRFVTRQVFDPALTRRELRIIRDDLHCNAVHLQGTDVTRLTTAAAEPLHDQFPGLLVFCVGTEASLFTAGIVPGRTEHERIAAIRQAGLRSSPYRDELQAFLAEAAQRVRKVFHGPLTYASTPFEVADWSLFDFIGVDLYRNSKNDHRYAQTARRYVGRGKPAVNTEFGHSSYLGDQAGPLELGEVDYLSVWLHRIPLAGRLVRPRLKPGAYHRDEEHQARELTKTLSILEAEGMNGAFIWTFADPWLIHTADPRHDLDMASTSLVKTCARAGGTKGLPWEPKPAFDAVAEFYATR